MTLQNLIDEKIKEFEYNFIVKYPKVLKEDDVISADPQDIKDFLSKSLKEIAEKTVEVIRLKDKSIPSPTWEEDMDYHVRTGNHLYRCSYCDVACDEWTDEYECDCSFWSTEKGKARWYAWKSPPVNEAVQGQENKISKFLSDE